MRKIGTSELRTIEAGFGIGFLDFDLNNGCISIEAPNNGGFWITLCLVPGSIDLQLRESDDEGNPGAELLGIRSIYSVLNSWFPVVFNRWWL